jgi:hypothetical protein
MCFWTVHGVKSLRIVPLQPQVVFTRAYKWQGSNAWHFLVPALQRHNTKNSNQIFPQKELRGLGPKFQIHVFVSNLYIPVIGLSILLQENMGTDPANI